MSETLNKLELLPSKHVGSFLFLIFIAIFRPTAIWPNFPISLEPIGVLAIGCVLFYKIYATIGFKAFWHEYKVELLLITAYAGVCFYALYLNQHRYENMQQIVRYGITFIVITMAFPAAIFLFSLPNTSSRFSLSSYKYSRYLPWLFFTVLALFTIWQSIDYQSSKWLGQYFTTSEAWPVHDVTGFFRVSTDLGFVLGLVSAAVVIIVAKSFQNQLRNQTWMLIVLLLLLVMAGGVSGARVFYLTIAFALMTVFFQRKAYLLFLIIAFHCLVVFLPLTMVAKLSSFFPYLLPLYSGESLFISDFIPNFSFAAFGERTHLWTLAVELLDGHWLFGVSNGGFRLAGDYIYQNTHNLILQTLIDGGLIGGCILLILIYRCMMRLTDSYQKVMAFSVVAGLCVDFLADHSLYWIIITAFILSHRLNNVSLQASAKPIGLAISGAIIGVSLAFTSWLYLQKLDANNQLANVHRVASFIENRYFPGNIIVQQSLGLNYEFNVENKIVKRYRISEITNPIQVCLYKYLDNVFIFSKEQLAPLNNISGGSEFSSTTTTFVEFGVDDINCDGYQYPDETNVLTHKWHSDISPYILNEQVWPIWGNASLHTALFDIDKGDYQFEFVAKGHMGDGQWPKLEVAFVDALTEKQLQVTEFEIDSNRQQLLRFKFEASESARVYLKLSYVNDLKSASESEKRHLWLYPKTFEIGKIER